MIARVSIDTSELVALKDRVGRARQRFAKVIEISLNKTAAAGQAAVRQEMARVFDRPTPFVLASTFIKPAIAPNNLEAHVFLKDVESKNIAPAKALAHEVTGGQRAWKRGEGALRRAGLLGNDENAVPGGAAKLDAYGNMDRGQIVQIIAYFEAFPDVGYKANTMKAKRDKLKAGKAGKRYGVRYFLKRDRPGRGIYISEKTGFGYTMRPVLMFVRRAQYKRLLDMRGVVDGVVRTQFKAWFADEWRRTWDESK